MKQHDRAFAEALSIEEVPWNRLASPYGRAGEFPELLEAVTDEDRETAEEAAKILALNLETESILWQPTPWAMLFLARILGCAVESYLTAPNEADADVIMRILSLYAPVFNALDGITDDDHPQPLPGLSDLLQPERLLPETNTQADDAAEAGAFYAKVSEEDFYSYFHYAWVILAESLKTDISRLKDAQEEELAEAATLFLEAPLCEVLAKLTK